MNILIQLAIIFGFCFLGELIAPCLPFNFPSSILGMLLLFLALSIKAIKPRQLGETGDFLLQNMAFFFIPSSITIIDIYGLLEGKILQIFILCLITTILTFAVTAHTVQLVIKWQNKNNTLSEQKVSPWKTSKKSFILPISAFFSVSSIFISASRLINAFLYLFLTL
ncbi:MAG: CidA/LrgA family protein [Clostridiales bacterium]